MILRGMNRQTIFEEEEDAQKFLEVLDYYKELIGYKIYAYCLMGNHIKIIKGLCNVSHAQDIQGLDTNIRNQYLKQLKQEGISTRQLARLTGINRNVIIKA